MADANKLRFDGIVITAAEPVAVQKERADLTKATLVGVDAASGDTFLRAYNGGTVKVQDSDGNELAILTDQRPFSIPVKVRDGLVVVAENVFKPGPRVRFAMIVTKVYAFVDVAPTGSALTVEVNRTRGATTTVLATLSIVAGATEAVEYVDVQLLPGDILTYDVTAVGSTFPGADLAVDLVGGSMTNVMWLAERQTLTRLIGHRGMALLAPENTAASYQLAMDEGVTIEADVWPASDGGLILVHDSTVDRTTASTGAVNTFTTAALQAIDNGSDFHPNFSAERFLTLPTALATWPQSSWMLENKSGSATTLRAIGDAVIAAGMQDRVIIDQLWNAAIFNTGGTPGSMTILKDEYPTIRSAPIYTAANPAPVVAELVAARCWGVIVDITAAWLTTSLVADCHAAGIQVIAYTIDTRVDRDLAVSLGVDRFISNAPNYVGTDFVRSLPATEDWDRDNHGLEWTTDSYATGPFGPTRFHVNEGFAGTTAIGGGDGAVWGTVVIPPNASWRLTTTLYPRALSGTITVWGGIQFCLQQDQLIRVFSPVTAGRNGYGFAMRQNGQMQLDRYTSGLAASTLATKNTTGSYAVGVGIPIQIDVTPSSITVTRLDNPTHFVTSSDTTFRGGRVGLLISSAAVEFGPITIVEL